MYTKKKSIMIVQYHSLMGKGTRKRKSTEEEPGINMIGNIYYKGSMERDAGSGLWWEKKEPSIAQTDFLLVK